MADTFHKKQVQISSRALQNTINKTTQALGINIHFEITQNTPVDTGWARANWIPSVDIPSEIVQGSPDNVDTNRAFQEILNFKRFDIKYNRALYITNNVPYISQLNDGSSPQVAKGFVKRAIQSVVRSLRAIM